jgi:tetrachlorobenzoquinone reductase
MESMAPSSASDAGMLAARLQSVRYAAKGVHLFEFASLNGPFPAAAPGAHLDICLPGEMRRQYSIVTPLCSASTYVVAVKREDGGRGGSIWLHDEASVGAEFRIGQPRNNFGLDEDAEGTLLLAGGIGITPIYAMFMRLQELKRRVHLHYWSRSLDHTLFIDQLKGHSDVTFHHSMDAGRATISGILREASSRTEVYACGPARMLDECTQSVAFAERLHIERFGLSEEDLPKKATDGFTVHLARKKIDVRVTPGETVLGALIRAGVDVLYSCEEGVCGACETKLLSGAALHQDSIRSPEEHDRRGTFMPCCSLSRDGDLVLDI